MKLNNKGFTLVELLAVMVILALLMVIVANVALPAMNKAKQNGLIVYVQRLAEKAQEMYMVDNSSGAKSYTVENLMGSDAANSYKGSISVTFSSDTGKYTTKTASIVYDVKNNICIPNSTEITSKLALSQVKKCSGTGCSTCS